MNLIDTTFENLQKENKKAKIGYIMSGFSKNIEDTVNAMNILCESGFDIIELGFPFSDPLADGKIIQDAAKISISNGFSLKKTIECVKIFRQTNNKTPVILMGYYNPILHLGLESFTKDCASSGVNGIIVPDLPFEEASSLFGFCTAKKIHLITLVTQLTTEERFAKMLTYSRGFIYFISVFGTTGQKEISPDELKQDLLTKKNLTNLPIVAGFGIKTPESAKQICNFADGFVIGSVLVDSLFNKNGLTSLKEVSLNFCKTL